MSFEFRKGMEVKLSAEADNFFDVQTRKPQYIREGLNRFDIYTVADVTSDGRVSVFEGVFFYPTDCFYPYKKPEGRLLFDQKKERVMARIRALAVNL